jgi:hypothetical protein
MANNEHLTIGPRWRLVVYHKNGSKMEFVHDSQVGVYERMCSASFADSLRKRGCVSWEMRQEGPHVV